MKLDGKKPHLWVAGLIGINLLVFSYSLKNQYVYDDHDEVKLNPYITSYKYIPQYFTKPFWDLTAAKDFPSNIYRPLKLVTYYIDFQIGGRNAFIYHFSNLLFHILVTIVFFLLLKTWTGGLALSFWGALLFSLHPAVSEVVYYIGARNDSLSFLFFLGSALMLLKKAGFGTALGAVALFFLSLLCKETPIILLPSLMLLAYGWTERRERWLLWGLLPLSVLAYVLIKKWLGITTPSTFFYLSFQSGIWWEILAKYLEFTILPFTPSGYREYAAGQVAWPAFVSVFLWLAVSALAWCFKRDRMLWLHGQLFAFASLYLATTLTYAGGAYADRYLYSVVMGGIMVMASMDWNRLKLSIALRKTVLSLIVLVYGGFSFAASAQWEDDLAFWSFAKEINEPSPRIHRHLGYYLSEEKRYEEAETEFRVAAALSKPHPSTRHIYLKSLHSLGVLYFTTERWAEAIEMFRQLNRLEPKNIEYRNYYFNLLVGSGQCERFLQEVHSQKLKPNTDVHLNRWLKVCNKKSS